MEAGNPPLPSGNGCAPSTPASTPATTPTSVPAQPSNAGYQYPPSPYGMGPHPHHPPPLHHHHSYPYAAQYGYHPHYFYSSPPPPPPPHQFPWQYPVPDPASAPHPPAPAPAPTISEQQSAAGTSPPSTMPQTAASHPPHPAPSFMPCPHYPGTHSYNPFTPPPEPISSTAVPVPEYSVTEHTTTAAGASHSSPFSRPANANPPPPPPPPPPHPPPPPPPCASIAPSPFLPPAFPPPPFAFYGHYPPPMAYPHTMAPANAGQPPSSARAGNGGAGGGQGTQGSCAGAPNGATPSTTGMPSAAYMQTTSAPGNAENGRLVGQTPASGGDPTTAAEAAIVGKCPGPACEGRTAGSAGVVEEYASGITDTTGGTDGTETCADGSREAMAVPGRGSGACSSPMDTVFASPFVHQVNGTHHPASALGSPGMKGAMDGMEGEQARERSAKTRDRERDHERGDVTESTGLENPPKAGGSQLNSPPVSGGKRKLSVTVPHASPSGAHATASHGEKGGNASSSQVHTPNNLMDSRRGRRLKPLDELHPTSIFRRRQRMLRQIKDIAAEFVGKNVEDLTSKDLSDTLLFALGSKTLVDVDAAYMVALLKDKDQKPSAPETRRKVNKRQKPTISPDMRATTAATVGRADECGGSRRQRRRNKGVAIENTATAIEALGKLAVQPMDGAIGNAADGVHPEFLAPDTTLIEAGAAGEASNHSLPKRMRQVLGDAGLELDERSFYQLQARIPSDSENDKTRPARKLLEAANHGLMREVSNHGDDDPYNDGVKPRRLERGRAAHRRRFTGGGSVKAVSSRRGKDREIPESNADVEERPIGERRGRRRKPTLRAGSRGGGGERGVEEQGSALSGGGRGADGRSRRRKEGALAQKGEPSELEDVQFVGETGSTKGGKSMGMRVLQETVLGGPKGGGGSRLGEAGMEMLGGEGRQGIGLRSRARKMEDDMARKTEGARGGKLAVETSTEEMSLALHVIGSQSTNTEEHRSRFASGRELVPVKPAVSTVPQSDRPDQGISSEDTSSESEEEISPHAMALLEG